MMSIIVVAFLCYISMSIGCILGAISIYAIYKTTIEQEQHR